MQTLDAIAARRQRRSFTDKPVPKPVLDRIFLAASRAPSARNLQRWDFVVVTDREKLDDLTGVWPGASWINRAAATIALIVPDTDNEHDRASIRFDLGQAAMLLMIAATDQGLASGQANCADQDLARSILGLPTDRECAMLIALGYPPTGTVEVSTAHARRNVSSLVRFNHWSTTDDS